MEDLQRLRQVLEEHLQAINENTTEIQALFDYLQEVERKVDILSQRIDVLQLSSPATRPLLCSLTHTEQKIFSVLYTEESPLSYMEIANRARLPVSLVPEFISALVNKGIPLERSFFNDQLFLKLDMKFKELQAKENILNLSLQSFIE